jgi:hypothetical protein
LTTIRSIGNIQWINKRDESDLKELENVNHLKYNLNHTIYTNRSETVCCSFCKFISSHIQISFQPAHVHTPETEQEIYEIIMFAKKHNENVKVLGGAQSPNDVLNCFHSTTDLIR